MIRRFVALALLAFGVAAAAHAQARPTTDSQVERVSAADAKKAVDAGEAVLVDVRHALSYQGEHATGALHLSADQVEARWQELPREKVIITYCT